MHISGQLVVTKFIKPRTFRKQASCRHQMKLHNLFSLVYWKRRNSDQESNLIGYTIT